MKNDARTFHVAPSEVGQTLASALKRWLDQQGLAYEERDLTDPKIAEEAKARTGVRVAPITIVGSEVFYGTFPSQKPGLVKALGLTGSA